MEQFARTPEQIGHVLRRKRQADDITQTELSSKSQLRQSTISRVEAGDHGVKLGTLCSLLSALGPELVIRPRTKSSADELEELF